MKKIILSVFLFPFCLLSINAQDDSMYLEPIFDSTYMQAISFGMAVSQFSTNSGFKPGLEASVIIRGNKGTRTLEMAVFFDQESGKISGISIHHKFMLFKKLLQTNPQFKPYLFYNFIYRTTLLDEPLTLNRDLDSRLGLLQKTTYSSMEHHIGVGAAIKIMGLIYFHGDIGYGRYLGSIKHPCNPDKNTGIFQGGNGWGIMTKVGFGLNF